MVKTLVRQALVCSFTLFVLVISVAAQTSPYYITDPDGAKMWIIQNGALQATVSTFSKGSAIAVTDSVWLEDTYESGAVEYTLSGAPTGNTTTGAGVYHELLDGTTDGQYNYTAAWAYSNPVPVLRYDRHWQNPTVLFHLPPDAQPLGIAYDPTTKHLFFSFDGTESIAEFDFEGGLVNSFDTGLTGVRIAALAYDKSTDSLWFTTLTEPGTGDIYNYSKAGTQVASFNIPDLAGHNTLGGEFAESGLTTVPTTSPIGLAALGLLIGLAGLVALRSRV